MKVERKYTPIVITLESAQELETLLYTISSFLNQKVLAPEAEEIIKALKKFLQF